MGVPPSPEYLKLVTRYASGEYADTVALIGSWSEDRLLCDLHNLQAAAAKARNCTVCSERLVFARFPVQAAIMLHADREILEQFRPPVSEQPPQCGRGLHARAVERLAAMLILVDPEPGVFLKRFFLGMARHAHWSHCLRRAQEWARAGLKWLPRDGTLRLALGVAAETDAFLTLAPAARLVGMGSQAINRIAAQSADLRDLWEGARHAFEEALKVDPELHEARLRLGRVLWRLKRPEPARACFEAVLAQSNDTSLQYLAHLFLGRIHEDKGQLQYAEGEYERALSMRPLSESAAVAVSNVRLLLGDHEGSREVLGQALDQVRSYVETDPFKSYLMTHSHQGQTILDELRRGVGR